MKQFWRRTIKATVTTTWANSDLFRVEPGRLYVVKRALVKNTHSSNTLDLEIGVATLDYLHIYDGKLALAALDYHKSDMPFIFREGDIVRLRLKGSASSTTVEAYFQGYWIKI